MAQENGRVTPKKPRSEPQVEVDFDPNKLTVGDLMDLEEHFGVTIDSLLSLVQGKRIERLPAKVLAAFVFVMKRQMDPTFPPSQVRSIGVADLAAMVGGGVPTVADEKPRLAGSGGAPETRPTHGD